MFPVLLLAGNKAGVRQTTHCHNTLHKSSCRKPTTPTVSCPTYGASLIGYARESWSGRRKHKWTTYVPSPVDGVGEDEDGRLSTFERMEVELTCVLLIPFQDSREYPITWPDSGPRQVLQLTRWIEPSERGVEDQIANKESWSEGKLALRRFSSYEHKFSALWNALFFQRNTYGPLSRFYALKSTIESCNPRKTRNELELSEN